MIAQLKIVCSLFGIFILAGCQSVPASKSTLLSVTDAIGEVQRVCTSAGAKFEQAISIVESSGYIQTTVDVRRGEEKYVNNAKKANFTLFTAPNGFITCKLFIQIKDNPNSVESSFLNDPRVKKVPIGQKSAFYYSIGNSGHRTDFRGPFTSNKSPIVAVNFIVSQIRD